MRVLGFDIQTGTELRRWHVMLCIYTVTVLEFASERVDRGVGDEIDPLEPVTYQHAGSDILGKGVEPPYPSLSKYSIARM